MCRIDYDDSDGQWLREPHWRTARKPHNCEDCGRTIHPGETYRAGTWIQDGDLSQLKMCEHCLVAGNWLNHVCGGHFYPGVMEELVEHWVEEPDYRSVTLGRLIVAGRKHWRRKGELIPTETLQAWVDDALTRAPAFSIEGMTTDAV